MTDALDHVAVPAGDLLGRVDDLLARFGAPDDDPVWPLLRRVRALPGEAVSALAAALRAAPVASAGDEMRARSAAFAGAQAVAATPVPWDGPAGEAYAAHGGRLSADLAAAGDALFATGRLADEVADWIDRTRARLARVLADVLASAEAVSVVLGADDAARAAATIATRVLSTLDVAISDGETLWRPPTVGRGATAGAQFPASYERITRLGG
ncbi:hypothetical protein [Asanoa sp. NPDC050611]|uniref:hypothetical protein n=1 Tax=Asanoa sp. NPDC050611 TaxID=3157098 RepID=UPI0033CBC7BB